MLKAMPTAIFAGTFSCALLASAWAQDPASSRDIAVVQKPLVDLTPAEPPKDLRVTATLDHPDGVYHIGDEVRISVHTNRDAYITILDVGTSGSTTVIFPNRSARSNRVRANETLAIPAGNVLQIGSDSGGHALGLHPALTGIRDIFNQGRMALIQRAGYANSSRSHFQGTNIWSTANPSNSQGAG